MEKTSAIQEIRERTNQIAANVTAMHPLVPKLADAPAQAELLKALFELTNRWSYHKAPAKGRDWRYFEVGLIGHGSRRRAPR
ncbi:MAG TPA: hypothetical protein VGR78_15845 [Verrucomicrobiae bacterium]|jgi:hypothetical protein|nr:hypothetical protein [Verrucomicrobiae bacterium]